MSHKKRVLIPTAAIKASKHDSESESSSESESVSESASKHESDTESQDKTESGSDTDESGDSDDSKHRQHVCQWCDDFVNETYRCEHCGHRVCNDCVTHCRGCEEYICRPCKTKGKDDDCADHVETERSAFKKYFKKQRIHNVIKQIVKK